MTYIVLPKRGKCTESPRDSALITDGPSSQPKGRNDDESEKGEMVTFIACPASQNAFAIDIMWGTTRWECGFGTKN